MSAAGSGPRRLPARRLGALLCAALVGLLVAVGLVVGDTTGTVGTVVYAVVTLLVLVAAFARGRRVLAEPALPPGRTCTCCTTSQHDPVRVI